MSLFTRRGRLRASDEARRGAIENTREGGEEMKKIW